MENKGWKEEDSRWILPTYGEREIAFVKGEGVYLWDVERRRYLDFLSGIGVNVLGYSHPRLIRALKEQAEKLLHISNLYLIPSQIELARRISHFTFPGKTFFCNSGAEAVEASLKFARKWGKGRFEVISMKNSFHGRTYGALTLTGQEKFHKGFHPLLPGIRYAILNDFSSLQREFNENTCAVVIEPIQGEGGIYPCKKEFLRKVREFTREKNLLLILDEVQCGMGRTGYLFAYQEYGIEPDVLVMAKGLGGGLPIGAMHVKEEFSSTLKPGEHASTFGGNPLSTRVACEVMDILTEAGFLEKVRERAEKFWKELKKLKEKFPVIKEIRGKGFMVGVEVEGNARKIRREAEKRGLLIGTSGERVLRFLPPLIIKEKEIEEGMEILEEVLKGGNFEA